jgi:peptidoglycan/xylan/chitin deacetylase (PgdA/CDA1 family)
MAAVPKLLGALLGLMLAVSALPSSTAAATAFRLSVPVLIYHHVTCTRPSNVPNTQIWICPARFENQLAHLKSKGWRAITTDQLAQHLNDRTCPGPRRFVVTIDDSSVYGYTNAAPILERLGMRATYFVVVGLAGRPEALSFSQMRSLVSRGHAIGNHTMAHVDLVGRRQSSLDHQVEGAQVKLKSELGFRPRTFAYPNGTHDKNARQRARDSGFELAFTADPTFTVATNRRMQAPRLFVSKHDEPTKLARKIEPYADPCP